MQPPSLNMVRALAQRLYLRKTIEVDEGIAEAEDGIKGNRA